MKFTLNIDPDFQGKIESFFDKQYENVSSNLLKGMDRLATWSESKVKDLASNKLDKQGQNRQLYESAVRVEKKDDHTWSVSLDTSNELVQKLEDGYPSFDMKPGLLRYSVNEKGGKNKKDIKDYNKERKTGKIGTFSGFRYRVIPFEHTPSHKNPSSPFFNQPVQIQNYAEDRKEGEAPIGRTTTGSMMQDLDKLARKANLTGGSKNITHDRSGRLILGKVATINQNDDGSFRVTTPRSGPVPDLRQLGKHKSGRFKGQAITTFEDKRGRIDSKGNFRLLDKQGNAIGVDKNMLGLTKFQHMNESGTKPVSSFLTFRTVSEKSSGWIHPGFGGVKAFDALPSLTDAEINKIIEKILK